MHLKQQPISRHDNQGIPLCQVCFAHQLPCMVLVLWKRKQMTGKHKKDQTENVGQTDKIGTWTRTEKETRSPRQPLGWDQGD